MFTDSAHVKGRAEKNCFYLHLYVGYSREQGISHKIKILIRIRYREMSFQIVAFRYGISSYNESQPFSKCVGFSVNIISAAIAHK